MYYSGERAQDRMRRAVQATTAQVVVHDPKSDYALAPRSRVWLGEQATSSIDPLDSGKKA